MALTNNLFTQVRSDVKDDLEALFLYGAIGEDSTAADATDTELGKEVSRNAITAFDKTSQVDKVTISAEWGTTEANGASVAEIGWLSASDDLIEGCDAITGFTDSTDMTVSVNATEFKENDASLNLTKDGTSSTTASTSKTVTSINFTNKTLNLWLYIVDSTTLNYFAATDGVTIRYGNDASNYYQWTKDRADLAVGWNFIGLLNGANADSTTGTVTETAMDYFYIAIETTVSGDSWSAGDVIMDNIFATAGTLYQRDTITAINKTDDINLYLDDTITITVTES